MCAAQNVPSPQRMMFCALQMGASAARLPLGKHVLPTVLWDKLESTPYGHNGAPDGSAIIRPVDAKLAERQRSHVMMNHYGFRRGYDVRSLALYMCRCSFLCTCAQ